MKGGGGVTTLMPCPGSRGRPLLIELRNPWENGYSESFNGKLRDELLDQEIICAARETQVLSEWCSPS
jgi:Integrase core domain